MADPARSGLERLALVLKLARERALVLVRVADASALRSIDAVVRADSPGVMFAPTGAAVLDLPVGSTALLWLRHDDLAGLNLGRELFRTRSLRVVVVATEGVADALRDEAPDLYDWMAHRLDLSEEPPGWAVENVRTILSFGGAVRIAWWGSSAPEATLTAARDWPVVRASAVGSWSELCAAAARPGWRIWEGVRGPWDEQRVRYAEASVRAEGVAVIERPALDLPGWWRVHASAVELEAAVAHQSPRDAGEWSALLATGFEPEVLGLTFDGAPTSLAWATDIARTTAAARLTASALRRVTPEAYATERRAASDEAVGCLQEAGWPVLGELPALEEVEAALACEAIRQLSEHAASFLVERMIHTGATLRGRVESVLEARHLDVAAEWVSRLPEVTEADRLWKHLLRAVAREGEGVYTDIGLYEGLVTRARKVGEPELLGACLHRLGQARFDGMDLRGARGALREALGLPLSVERGFDVGLLEAEVTHRLGPTAEAVAAVRALASWAVERGDEVREARCLVFLLGFAEAAGDYAERQASGVRPFRVAARHLTLFKDLIGSIQGPVAALSTDDAMIRQGRLAQAASMIVVDPRSPAPSELSPKRTQFADELRFSGARVVDWAEQRQTVERLGRASQAAGDTFGAVLSDLLRVQIAASESRWNEVTALGERAAIAAESRGEWTSVAAMRMLQARASFAMGAGDLLQRFELAWAAVHHTSAPQLYAQLAEPLVPLLQSSPDPRVPRLLTEALDLAARYPDDDSAWIRPRMLKLTEEALAEARRQLHRARSMRATDEIKRWKASERKLRAILDAAGVAG